MNERDAQRFSSNRQELVERLLSALPTDGYRWLTPWMLAGRASRPSESVHGVVRPSFCLIAQGAKEVSLGDKVYRYDADRYLIVTVEMPVTARVVEASVSEPYLALKIDLDPSVVTSLMIEAGLLAPPSETGAKAIAVSALDLDLLDATLRLVRLIDSEEALVLAPMVLRELTYRLMRGDQGERLRHLPKLGHRTSRIAEAVHRIRSQFDQPMQMEALAQELGMSTSGFHHHFKAVTDMSPLQFQKQLRLQAARSLLIHEDIDVASAGYHVGYADPSHFSRDYKKQFGNPPLRDMESLRQVMTED